MFALIKPIFEPQSYRCPENFRPAKATLPIREANASVS